MGYTHFDRVSGINSVAVGANGSEVVIADSSGNLYQAGTQITATAAELNAIAGGGLDSTELGILDGATVTTAELNTLDVSAQTETGIAAGGTVDETLAITQLDSSGGAGAVTLAAPPAAMLGKIKIIEMTVAGNALTMALTNVLGGSAATTATFDAVDEVLTLVGGATAWHVLGESGVTLT